MEPVVFAAAAAGFTLLTGALGLRFSQNQYDGYRAASPVSAQMIHIPHGLKTPAKYVERFYRDHGVQIFAISGDVGFQTRTIVFSVPPRVSTKKMTAVRGDLEHFLMSYGVSMIRNSLNIDVAGNMTLSWAVRSGREVKLSAVYRRYYRDKRPAGGVFPIGVDMEGNPFCVRLNKEASPHALIVGSSGSGKTLCAMCIAIGAIYSGWNVVILNPKTKPNPPRPGLWDFSQSRNCTYVHSYADMTVAINRIAYNLEGIGNPTLIIADELADIIESTGRDVADPLGSIAGKGREYGVHIVGIVPKITKGVLLNDQLHANAGAVLIGTRMNSSYLARYGAGWGDMGLERLAGNGHAKVKYGTEIAEIQVALPDNVGITIGNVSAVFKNNDVLPIADAWIDSVVPGGDVSKDSLRKFASKKGDGIGYDVVRQQYDLLVQLGRIEPGAKFQSGKKIA